MTKRFWAFVLLAAAAGSAGGCKASKSSNPLSPTVAGPIPGVQITAPKLLLPSAGQRIATDQQPVTLTIENASTSGQRPLTYVFEVASDAGFTTKVYSREGIQPGDGGRTSLPLPEPLASGHTYYWRAQALDGANTGAVPAPANFDVYTPVVIQAPTPTSPGDGVTVSSLQPSFTVRNATRTGPAGAVTYQFQVADSAAFGGIVLDATVGEGASSTTFKASQALDYSRTYFWRVRAADPTTAGPWSPTLSFHTPDQPVVAPPTPTPTPTPAPGGSAAADQLDMGSATILNSPRDIASWPITTALTMVDVQSRGVQVTFDRKDGGGRWPDVTPPGWDGPLQYTLGMCLNISGRWYCSAVVEYWYGLQYSGGAPSEYAMNWFYDPGRWAPMTYHQPAVGETIGFYVCEGDCRNNPGGTLSPLRERTNVVLVKMPSDSGATYRF